MTDGERLIKIETILNELKTDFDNHLKHHLLYSLMAWSATLGLLTTIIIMLIK